MFLSAYFVICISPNLGFGVLRKTTIGTGIGTNLTMVTTGYRNQEGYVNNYTTAYGSYATGIYWSTTPNPGGTGFYSAQFDESTLIPNSDGLVAESAAAVRCLEKLPIARITTTAEGFSGYLTLDGIGRVIIDWGDGSDVQRVPLGGYSYYHNYAAGSGTKTITIIGDLTMLKANDVKATAIDVSEQTALKTLHCQNNQLTGLDITNNTELTDLNCGFNQIEEIDVTQNTELKIFVCAKNLITELDVTQNAKLELLGCGENPLTEVNVDYNPALTQLECSLIQLPELDVTNNPALTYLNCRYNQLVTLDLTQNTALVEFNCENNNLIALDVTNSTALEYLYCQYNNMDESALNALYTSLPDRTSTTPGLIMSYGSPGYDDADQNIATEKGWSAI